MRAFLAFPSLKYSSDKFSTKDSRSWMKELALPKLSNAVMNSLIISFSSLYDGALFCVLLSCGALSSLRDDVLCVPFS